MPLTRGQQSAGITNDQFEKPSPAQLKAQLRSLDISNYIPLGSYSVSTTRIHFQGSSDSVINVQELFDNPSSYLAGNISLADNLNLLLLHHWIRIFVVQHEAAKKTILRVYALPDDVARELIVRDSAKLRSALRSIIASIDCSSAIWNLEMNIEDKNEPASYIGAAEATDSLYYLFNNVSSPEPNADTLDKDINFYAIEDILSSPSGLDLSTVPYEYQQRSAAAMLVREAEPQYHIDPRFEEKLAPNGESFYLDTIEGSIMKEANMIEDVRGGILAENMGAGKTFISILLILATKGHPARLRNSGSTTTNFTGPRQGSGSRSLKETVARAIRLHAVPYKVYLEEFADILLTYMHHTPPWYSSFSVGKTYLSSTTLIVVPPNLISHWQDEITKHVQAGKLSVYTAVNDNISLPEVTDLLKYDVILTSKPRFEDEFSPRQSIKRQQADEDDPDTEGHVCVCVRKRRACAKHPYITPLAQIHFLRVIVDEALGFSKSAFDNKASAALEKLKAERKWLVSGTPSKGLRGVEIDMAMQQNKTGSQNELEKQTLDERRARPSMETEEDQVKRFGYIVTNFFRAKPWYRKGSAEKASWTRYMIPDKYGKGKPGNLQAVVESLVVRHQMHEVDKEAPLPPLSNIVVYLDASPMDKMSLNLFTAQMIFNAVTSEREDQDYIFHPSQKKHLAALFQNLRHANFYWTGISHADLLKGVETAERYLAKNGTKASTEDRMLLSTAIDIARQTLECSQWQAGSTSKEMGMFVEGFPDYLRNKYAMATTGYRNPLLMTTTDVRKTQEEVAARLYATDPFYTLWRSAGDETWRYIATLQTTPSEKKGKTSRIKGISSSIYDTNETSPTKRRKSKVKEADEIESFLPPVSTPPKLKSALKAGPSRASLPGKYKELSEPCLVATSSTKLSYLLDKIMSVCKDEKSIIFYEDPNIGYWLAQALEVVGVTHEIYASGIKESLRLEYMQNFENGEHIRVLLMDLRRGSHGLHLASVTRVFFVNPVWDETVEAQAIKRAHRIGQTKPVYIETMVLRGTLEDQMLRRRKNMTGQELQQTSKGPTSDPMIHDIIKNAAFLPMSHEEWTTDLRQCAPLKQRYQLYGREFIGHPDITRIAAPVTVEVLPEAMSARKTVIKIRNLPRRPCTPQRAQSSSPAPLQKLRNPYKRSFSTPMTPVPELDTTTCTATGSKECISRPKSLGDAKAFLELLAKLGPVPMKHHPGTEIETVQQTIPLQEVVPFKENSITKWKQSFDSHLLDRLGKVPVNSGDRVFAKVKRSIEEVERPELQPAAKKKKGVTWAIRYAAYP